MIKKYLISIVIVGLCFGAIATYADNYGVSDQGDQADQTGKNASEQQASQQAVIDALLKKAHAYSDNNNAAVANQAVSSTQSMSHDHMANNHADDNAGGQVANSANDEAFAKIIHNMMPLSPQQIKTLRYMFNQSQQAAAAYPGTPPRPTSTSLTADLSPGATPPIIRLRQGYVSSLVFLDATGAPWPIKAIDWGNPQAFNIQWDKKGNTLLVQAMQRYASGNIAVMLKGLNTPVMLTFMAGQRAVDYRLDIRVPRMGPNANPVTDGLPQTESPELVNVLDGIPPKGSQILHVEGGEASAWLLDNHIFVRTTMTLLSPAWISTMSSSDGTHAYEVQKTPVILAISHGTIVKLMIKGL